MSDFTGRETIIGIAQASVWDTEVVVGAGDGIVILSDQILNDQSIEQLADDSVGLSWRQDQINGREVVAGGFESEHRYDGNMRRLLAAIFGSDVVSTPGGATDARLHTMEPVVESPYFFTVVYKYDTTYIREVVTWKPLGFTLSGEAGQVAQLSIRGIGSRLITNEGSGTNNTTTADLISFEDRKNFPLSINTRFAICNANALQLALQDQALADFDVMSFELRWDRDEEGDYVINSGCGIDEPRSNGYGEAKLGLTFDVPDANTLALNQARNSDNLLYYGRLNLVGNEIDTGTNNYTDAYEMRKMKLASISPNISGPGKIRYDAEFDLLSDDVTVLPGIADLWEGPLRNLLTTRFASPYVA